MTVPDHNAPTRFGNQACSQRGRPHMNQEQDGALEEGTDLPRLWLGSMCESPKGKDRMMAGYGRATQRDTGASLPPTRLLFLFLALTAFTTVAPHPAAAQDPSEETAQRFFDALSRLRWERVSAELHTAALDEFHLISRQLVESLRGDSILIQLYDASRAEWDGWSSRDVFERSMTGLTRYARGLMESQVMTDFRVLGTVSEGDTIRHVVYRETTDHMGLVIEAAPTTTLVLEGGQ